MTTETQERTSSIFPVKTTGGQEKTVATFVASRAAQKKKPIYSILALDTWKGYVLFEAATSVAVDESIQGFKHVRSKIPGMMQYKDVEKFLVTKSMIAELSVGDTIEIVAGLSADDQIVVNPSDSIVAGQAVKIVQATLPGDSK